MNKGLIQLFIHKSSSLCFAYGNILSSDCLCNNDDMRCSLGATPTHHIHPDSIHFTGDDTLNRNTPGRVSLIFH